jgi:hypothetical protein
MLAKNAETCCGIDALNKDIKLETAEYFNFENLNFKTLHVRRQ